MNDVLVENSFKLFNNNAHPTPICEYNFWKKRYLNLQNIYIQLIEPHRKLIMDTLDKNNSVYIDPLKSIFQRTIQALIQSKHVKIHMKAFTQQIKILHSNQLHQCKDFIEPILHCICLMWRENPYYPFENWNLLFQMIVNMMIEESNKNLDIDSIFQSDIDDSCFKIRETIKFFDFFKLKTITYKSKLNEYKKKPEQPVKIWSFRIVDVFQRHDVYVQRLKDIEEMLLISIDFMKLDKIDFGGIRGQHLYQNHYDLLNEFHLIYNSFAKTNFSSIEMNDNINFQAIKIDFDKRIKTLERKLAQILRNAFENCTNCIESMIKLIEMIGWLLKRAFIHSEILQYLRKFLKSLNVELDSIEMYFDWQYEHQIKVKGI